MDEKRIGELEDRLAEAHTRLSVARRVCSDARKAMGNALDTADNLCAAALSDLHAARTELGKESGIRLTLAAPELTGSTPERRRSEPTTLRVTFDDGTVFHGLYAKNVFAVALVHMGLADVAALGKTLGGKPLVAAGKRSKDRSRIAVDGYVVLTRSSTERKAQLLREIAASLEIGVTVLVEPR
jgi:hypothetical protein